LAAACTAAEQNHAVTLLEVPEVLGGQFNSAKRVPGKEELHGPIRYFELRLANLAPGKSNGKSTVSARLQVYCPC
jgi:2,4-dienoyl-CoA reductase (NADPH2)